MSLKKIKINLKDKSCDIFIQGNIQTQIGRHLKEKKIGKKILIVTQNRIPVRFVETVKQSLLKSGFKVFTLTLPSGEQYKNLDSLLKIVNFAVKNKFERKDSFIALGGGVVSDLTGFAASIYYRGVNFICIPTTLLGMVDASIGGKTAINIKEGKNLVGTFYQPEAVFIDPTFLSTLPEKEFLIGMAEVIKYALLEKTSKTKFSKIPFFKYLKLNREKILSLDTKAVTNIIYYSALAKANIVSKDEKESNLRAILNLGHTFAHGIEQAYNYKAYTHGEAVSIGTCLASRLAAKHKLISEKEACSIIDLISEYGLPTTVKKPIKLNAILNSMLLDKKVENGKLKFILPYGSIGQVKIVNNIGLKEVRSLLK
jgi:3-dehydroquinate synthase